MPNLNHLWQRFLLTSSFFVGLAIGIVAAVFGYSNLQAVDLHLWVFHINAVPLWTVAVVPLAITLAAGTLYHWVDGLHHFTEHMRHRRRVHELEAEVASLRAHLDQVLEMPDHSALTAKTDGKAALPPLEEEAPLPAPVETEPAAVASSVEPAQPAPTSGGKRRNRVKLTVAPEPATAEANGADMSADTTAAAEPAQPNPGE